MGRFGRLLLHLALDFGTFEGAGRRVAGLSVVWEGLERRRKPQWPKCVHRKRNNKRVLRSEKKHFSVNRCGDRVIFSILFDLIIFLFFRDLVSEWTSIVQRNRLLLFYFELCNTGATRWSSGVPLNVTQCFVWIRSECEDWWKQHNKRYCSWCRYLLKFTELLNELYYSYVCTSRVYDFKSAVAGRDAEKHLLNIDISFTY